MLYRQHTEKFLQIPTEAWQSFSIQISSRFSITGNMTTQLPVMEYIQGGTLSQKLTGKPMDWQTSARLLAQVARALESAHQQSIIHRDVKPANILISNDRELLLSDFGIAKLIAGDEETVDLTGSGVGIGTPVYGTRAGI
jgi:serine/threonine protein kinase